jgi:DNA-binding PadR family transcriptional regulator
MAMGVRDLSELEGAILSEIEHRGRETTFQVRRAFAESVSLEWKGSAGGVYPAVRRLEQDGLILASEPAGGRKARTLSLTEIGREALTAWACDPLAGTSVGADPFRLRSGIWLLLPEVERKALFAELDGEITRQVVQLERLLSEADPVEPVRLELALDLQRSRLASIRKWRGL